MTTYKDRAAAPTGRLTLAEILEIVTAGEVPLKFTAYDGSTAGPEDAVVGLDLKTPRGTTYLATSPGELGLARAYVSGDLDMLGVHPRRSVRPAQGHGRQDGFQTAAGSRAGPYRRLDRRGTSAAHRPAPPARGTAALAPARRGVAAQQDPRCRGHPPPLRRVEHVLRVGARPVDDLYVCVLSGCRRHPGAGPGQQIPAGVRQVAPPAR